MKMIANTKAARIAARWTPANGTEQHYCDIDAIIWRYTQANKFNVCIYQGSKAKPVLHAQAGSIIGQEKIVENWVHNQRQKLSEKEKYAAENAKYFEDFFGSLEIGCIFYTLSGYEQTSASFFEVVGEVKNNMVLVRPIAHEQVKADPTAMYGYAVPKKGVYTGSDVKWKVKNNYPRVWSIDKRVNISWYG